MIIFKRKQAVLILVVCMILVAGYINWAYQKDTSTNIASELASTEITTENNDDENNEGNADTAEDFNHKTDSLIMFFQCNIIVFILHIMIKL